MLSKSTWALIAAAIAAVVTVAAAIVVVADRAPTTIKKITGTTAHTPGLAWTLDAAEYVDRPFADFSDPRHGSSYSSGQPGFILSGNTLVTMIGIPTDSYTLDDAVMVGIDPEDGTVQWDSPAPDLRGCSDKPLGGKIYCYALNDSYALVRYDIESGESERRTIPESVFGLTTDSDTLYIVEGNPEDDDVRVHSGTFDNVSANWSRSFDIEAAWEEVFGSDVLTVTDGVGLLRMGIGMTQFDAATGAEVFGTDNGQCVSGAALIAGGSVTQANSDCTSSEIASQVLRGPDGTVLAAIDNPGWQRPLFANAADGSAPVLLGDSAYDRTTGERLWTNPELVVGTQGAVAAVVDDVVYVRGATNDGETGVRLSSGTRLWRNTAQQMFSPESAAGTVLVGTDGAALTAFDAETGKVVWTAPFVAIDSDPEAFKTGSAVEPYNDGWIFSSDRKMIGLAPL